MGSKSAGKADTISPAGTFLITDSKSITVTQMPEVGLSANNNRANIVYTVRLRNQAPPHPLNA